jgi:hypothetical protein
MKESGMAQSAIDYVSLLRICEFARTLHSLNQSGGGDEMIDREFAGACRAIWRYTLDDFTDDDLSPKDHAWVSHAAGSNRFCRPSWLRPQGLRPWRLGE